VASIRVALLSDDRSFSDGVARILQIDDTFAVNVHDSVTSLERAARTGRADVLVVDSRMDDALAIAGGGGLASASILIEAPNDAAWCRDAICAGVSGVLPKNSGAGALIGALRAVADGSVWAPRRVMAECIKQLASASAVASTPR
jgi:DNA-binding NarL/FixJ family response regulator